jgi:hypothetical protein
MNSMTFSLLANSSSEVDENQKMELMIGSLSFCIGLSGTIRPSDPTKLDPSANKVKIVTMSRSLVGSSSEVNSRVSFTTAEDTGGKIEELDKITEKLNLGETVGQSYPGQKDFVTQTSGISGNIQQLCVIITEAAEENDHADNIAIDMQVDKSRRPGSGESSCQPSIMARKYPLIQEEKF